MYSFTPIGVCAQKIIFSISDGVVKDVAFSGGCSGNLQGISRLVDGMQVEEAIVKLRGITCGGKITSCPDQLAKALETGIKKQAG
ncbi:TIGR03905 family TSCPD domain-containing protein [Geosporobacter ferrireducens]|uniref:ribonucleoside-diphosphate reductase n=1 Tax=Geosporobacter ferrireducens TaxID=1424294 RepID=A0A1D8GF54_9FIRM|nr:TIGR03905 family TSCPD domain-containing protein [Geosporobacter ferrireducens]AOT69536.1 TIGR03905 family protein [Geosporobacter ferrireducens]MTI54770.1 TIGR03905 family TSCPD domain-containing protein [Geosporobacter ferrireducens]